MTTAEVLSKIKALFIDAPPTPPVVPALPAAATYPLADGTVASIDNLSIGGIVTIDGVPAQDGVIVLADGTAVTTEGGVITQVAAAQAADPSTDLPGQMAAMEAKFTAQQAAYDDNMGKLQAQAATHTEAFAQLISLVEKMAETEIAAPVEVKKDFSEMTKLGATSRRSPAAASPLGCPVAW